MASAFNVTSNHYLRMIYMGNTDVMKRIDREDKPSSRLNAADSKALRKGLDSLTKLDLNSMDKTNEKDQNKFYNTVKAFADAYNNTLESGSTSTNASIRKIADKIKKLSSKNASEFADYGIKFTEDGYMNLKESTLKSMSPSNYKDLIGQGSEYNRELASLAKQMSRHIDFAV